MASKGRKVCGGTFSGGVGPKKESESESAFLGSKTGKNNEISANFKEFYFLKKENGAVFRENAV